MKIKKILCLGGLFLGVFTLTLGAKVYAADEEPTQPVITETTPDITTSITPVETTTDNEQENEETTYPCQVVEMVTTGGNVLTDITEGNVGDKVTAYIKPDFLFSTSLVKINDVEQTITKDGVYEFELVEGKNVITVEFKVNNEKLTEIAELLSTVKEKGFASLFTVDNLLILVYWVLTALFSSGFFITLIKSKKLKTKTVEEVQSAISAQIGVENAKLLNDFLNNVLDKALATITTKMDNVDDCMKVLTRCFILSQENTPESRLAIINELTKLTTSEEALTNKIKAIVKQEQIAQKEKIEARDRAIEELKENNNNLVSERDDQDNYGQI